MALTAAQILDRLKTAKPPIEPDPPVAYRGGTFRGTWAPAAAYIANDVVVIDGATIGRITDGVSGATFDATERAAWRDLVGSARLPAWAPLTPFSANQAVTQGGSTYVATSTHTSTGLFTDDLNAGLWLLMPVDGQVSAALAGNGAVAAAAVAAVNTAVAGKDIVVGTDARSLRNRTAAAAAVAAFSYVWLDRARKVLGGIRAADGYFQFLAPIVPAKVIIDSKSMEARSSLKYSRMSVGANGFVGEDAIALDGTVPQWVLDRWKLRMSLSVGAMTVVHVRPVPGVGEYATPMAANAAINDATTSKPYLVVVHPGDYVATAVANANWTLKDHIYLLGTEKDRCVLGVRLPDNSTDADITNTSGFWMNGNNGIYNLTVVARNARYPVHSDSAGAVKDFVSEIVNCVLDHEMNDGARTFRDANPGSGLGVSGNVWANEHPFGYGSSSGARIRFEASTLIGRTPWYMHDREDWAKPATHELVNCRCASRDELGYVTVESLGSGQHSLARFTGCEVGAMAVRYKDTPWISQAADNQVADHAQIHVSIAGFDKLGFLSSCRGLALKIESTSTGATSTVAATGTGADALMGLVKTRDGGNGVKGSAWGRWDISGILTGINGDQVVANTMGKRLGDCTGVAKVMNVVVDGGAPIVVTFNQNHTAQSNATVLGIINAALGGSATATEYDVVAGEVYPDFPDRIKTLLNKNAAAIPRWTAVKKSGRGIDIMGTGDAAALFYGITLQQVLPGKMVRVLTGGRIKTDVQLNGYTVQVAAGATIYHDDANAGRFKAAGTRPALIGIFAGWAEF